MHAASLVDHLQAVPACSPLAVDGIDGGPAVFHLDMGALKAEACMLEGDSRCPGLDNRSLGLDTGRAAACGSHLGCSRSRIRWIHPCLRNLLGMLLERCIHTTARITVI